MRHERGAVRVLLLLLAYIGRASGWKLVIEKAHDFVCTGGAGFIYKGPGGLQEPNMVTTKSC